MEQEVCGEEDAPYCGQVAPETQRVLADAVGCVPGTLFRAERASADFKWVVMPRFRDLVDAPGRGGIPGLAGRLDLDVARIERWMSHRESVAPETQLALLRDLGLPVEELDSLFTRRPPVDPERPGDVWWATGLRAAVRRHPGYRTLGRLAAELELPVETLFDQAEMLAPVPEDLRDRIKRLLAPASSGRNALFSTQAPDWDEFLWAPELRAALEQAEMGALELATALDVDLARVHDWMEMEKGDARTLWAKGKVKRGQICPATCDAIIVALAGRVERDQIFSVTRPDSGALWAVKPTFRIAVDAFEDRLVGFAEQVDTDPDRVERWADQVEPVGPDAQARVLEVFGMKPEDKGQLFSAKPRVEDAQG
jgi:hypothetical protein